MHGSILFNLVLIMRLNFSSRPNPGSELIQSRSKTPSLSLVPMLCHFDLASHRASWTSAKSSIPNYNKNTKLANAQVSVYGKHGYSAICGYIIYLIRHSLVSETLTRGARLIRHASLVDRGGPLANPARNGAMKQPTPLCACAKAMKSKQQQTPQTHTHKQ